MPALDAEFVHQPPRLARADLAFGRINRRKRDHDVAVGCCDFRRLLVLVSAKAGLALGVVLCNRRQQRLGFNACSLVQSVADNLAMPAAICGLTLLHHVGQQSAWLRW
jgi:hypothetical protein